MPIVILGECRRKSERNRFSKLCIEANSLQIRLIIKTSFETTTRASDCRRSLIHFKSNSISNIQFQITFSRFGHHLLLLLMPKNEMSQKCVSTKILTETKRQKRDDRSTETRLLFLIENVLQIFCRYRRSLVHFTSRFALSDDSVS